MTDFEKVINENVKKLEDSADWRFSQTAKGMKKLDERGNARFKSGVAAGAKFADGVKKHVSSENEETRKIVASSKAEIIEAGKAEATETRAQITNVRNDISNVRNDITKFLGIDVRIWCIIIPCTIIFFMIGWFKIGPAVANSGLFLIRNSDGTLAIDDERMKQIVRLMKWLFAILSASVGAFIADAIGSLILCIIDRRNNH